MANTDEVPTFETTDIPVAGDAPAADETPDIACSECGKDISYLYKGRGRKPTKCEEHKAGGATKLSSGGGGRGASGDVKTAVNALEQGYQLVVMGLMLAGAKESAALLSQSIPKLNSDNAKYLAGDKDLVRAINKVGKTSSRAGFFIAQVSVLAPVSMLAFQELRGVKEVDPQ